MADDRACEDAARQAFSVLLDFVAADIVDAMDNGRGELAPLPRIASPRWDQATERTKWAAIAVAALEGLKLAQRSDDDIADYVYTTIVVAEEIAFAAEAYQTGYDHGRRDQKQLDARIARNRQSKEDRT